MIGRLPRGSIGEFKEEHKYAPSSMFVPQHERHCALIFMTDSKYMAESRRVFSVYGSMDIFCRF